MNATENLNRILNNLHFSDQEKEAFIKAISITKDYMRDANIDMEKEFDEIATEVVRDAI